MRKQNRQFVAVMFILCGAVLQGCHRDLTPCRDESEGPACRDSAVVVDSDPADTGLPDVTGDTVLADVEGDAAADTAETAADATDSASDVGACEAGAYECTSTGELRTCADGGPVTIVTCPSASTCDVTNRRCSACTPGTVRCAGADRVSCTSLGTETIVTCASAELCAAGTGGSCMAAACAAGEKKCSGTTAMVCNSGRTAFDSVSCSIGCAAGSCVTVSRLVGEGTANHFCALLSDGTVRCWGLAGPALGEVLVPTAISGVTSAVQVAVGWESTGLRLSDGTVRLIGGFASGGGSTTAVAGITGATDLALGNQFGCWAGSSGIRCFGAGYAGQLGTPGVATATPPVFTSPAGVSLTGPISLGVASSFGIVSGGARAWGLNEAGQLGLGDYANRDSPTAAFPGALQIAAAGAFTCARTATGVSCVGANGNGQLGDGTTTNRSSPVTVPGIGSTLDIAVGDAHACALLSDGRVRCWGKNAEGQLGNGSTTATLAIVTVSGITAKEIAAVQAASCALLADSVTIKCWGDPRTTGTSVTPSPGTPVSVTW